MKKIAVIGTGYVGLVTGTCFAETGNQVLCVDIDVNKVEKMRRGEVPIYEPHLDVVFERNIKANKISFTTESFVNWPKIPDTEFIKINIEAEVTIFFGFSNLSKNNIGLKNIPPPIPTIPDIKPIMEPIKTKKNGFDFFILKLFS